MTTISLRTVLICHHDAPLHVEGIARWMASWSSLAGVVVIHEPASALRRRFRRERARVGLLRLLDVIAFRIYYRLRHGAQDAAWLRQQLVSLQQRYAAVPAATATIEVASPGSRESEEFIRAARPDLVIALCKNILPERVFGIPRVGTFVFHPGICPEYRNAHGCFWALASGDLTRVGMTLLKIDKGVDTGPIFGHFGVDFDEISESHIRIQNRSVLDNLDQISERLQAIAAGRAAPVNIAGRSSHEWGQPWMTAWLRWKVNARRRRGARYRT